MTEAAATPNAAVTNKIKRSKEAPSRQTSARKNLKKFLDRRTIHNENDFLLIHYK